MTHPTKALAIASVLLLGMACSEAPVRYSPQSSIQTFPDAANAEVQESPQSHPPIADAEVKEVSDAGPSASMLPAEPPAMIPPPPLVKTPEALNLEAIKSGKLMSLYTIPSGKRLGWGTSATNRIQVKIAVDANGMVLAPTSTNNTTAVSGNKDPTLDASFKGITTLHSVLKVCNDSGESMVLHSSNEAPFEHGDLNAPILSGTCVQYLVRRAIARDGATYEHNGGPIPSNFIYLQIEKIGPDGKIIP